MFCVSYDKYHPCTCTTTYGQTILPHEHYNLFLAFSGQVVDPSTWFGLWSQIQRSGVRISVRMPFGDLLRRG